MNPRRKFLGTAAAGFFGAAMVSKAGAASLPEAPMRETAEMAPPLFPRTGPSYNPVVTLNGWSLPWRMSNGWKEFHLVAEPVRRQLAPGMTANLWGYNGQSPGPTIECVQGDKVRIFVTNRLPEHTTVHWHGIILPNGMDGVGGLTQRAIRPGETFMYEFPLIQHGTFMYHSHHDEMTQMALGMMGLIVVHPREPSRPPPDRDYAFMLSEWKIVPGTRRPDPNEMTDFNVLTLNARAFPGTTPIVAKVGERVRLRFGNLSAMDHHPIHLHGHAFQMAETDGGEVPEAGRWSETTVLVPVGSTRTVELTADRPGDWAMHCHMTHHVMNQMGHGIPNMIGVDTGDLDRRVRRLLPGYMTMGETGMGDMAEMGMPVPANSIPMVGGAGPFDTITMGGMFTLLKVRAELPESGDPGWYEHPAGSVATLARPEDLARDGVEVDTGHAEPEPAPHQHGG